MLRRQLLKAAGFIPFLSLPKVEAYEYKNDPNVKIDYIDYADFSKIKHVVIFHKGDRIIVPSCEIKDKSQIDQYINAVYLSLKQGKYCINVYIIAHFDPNINYLAIYGIGNYEVGNRVSLVSEQISFYHLLH